MPSTTNTKHRPPQPRRVISPDDSEVARAAYENHISTSDAHRDPFDIVAEIEEELGHPLALN